LDERIGVATAGWEESGDIIVHDVSANMPAELAGLKAGDILVSIDGQPIRTRYKLQEVIRNDNGKPVVLVYSRDGQQHTVELTPVMSSADGPPHYMVGIAPALRLNVVTEQLSFPAALRESISQNTKNAQLIFAFLRGIVERRMSAKAIDGPIGIARESSRAAKLGTAAFLSLMVMVSLNLAIFNLLPIPILDGGVILTLLVEMLLGRDLSLAFKEGLLKVGFVFLMAVVVFVLYNDISKVLTQG
jgi:regulator of sigma E protease